MRSSGWLILALGLVIGTQSCGSDGGNKPDSTPPAAVADLNLIALTDSSGFIGWTAPGDDGNDGTAAAYDVRVAAETITLSNWDEAIDVQGEPDPQPAGSAETMEVIVEEEDQLLSVLATHENAYVAIRSVDDAGNWSDLSNILVVETGHDEDDTAPAAVINLALVSQTDSTATVSWTAPGDDGNQGTAAFYEVRLYNETITAANWNQTQAVPDVPAPQPAGAIETLEIDLPELEAAGIRLAAADGVTYIALRAVDEADNQADVSNNVAVIRSGEAEVTIPDANLLAELRAALGIPSGPITVNDMQSLAPNFTADNKGISDLTGIEFATNLTSLFLGQNNITLLTPLASMTQLEHLGLKGNLFNNLSPLSGLVNLVELNVSDNFVSDLSPLAGLTAMQHLHIDGNAASSIASVASMSDLLALTAQDTDVADLSPLAELAALTYLDLDSAQVADLGPLAGNTDFAGGDAVYLAGCPLSETSLDVHVAALESRGASVQLGPDIWPPAAVADLMVTGVTDTSATVSWTSPGGSARTSAASYDLRYSAFAITDGNWDSATQAEGEPTPAAYGETESLTLVFPTAAPGPAGTPAEATYYLALRSRDGTGNISELSNVVQADLLDGIPPGQVNSLEFVSFTETSITVEWWAPGDDDYGDGPAAAYEIRYATFAITEENWETATVAANPPTPQDPWSQETFAVTGLTPGVRHYVALRAKDEADNWSPVSNVVTAVPMAVTVVNIPDAALEAAVRDHLQIPSGDITTLDMAQMTSLVSPGSGISDLTGLEAATNVTYLNLQNNNITALGPLAGLTALDDLRLWNNAISDISPLSALVNLSVLNLGANAVTDVSPLSTLSNLATLYLYDNGLSDLTGLEGLSSIEYLEIWNNPVSDLSPLSGLTTLTGLLLSSTDVSNLGPLSALTNMEDLNLRDCEVSDLSPLTALVNMRSLTVSQNNVSDLGPVGNMTQLETLFANDNAVTDLTPLTGLNALTTLWLYNNNISSIAAIAGATNMDQISLFANTISDISPLAGFTKLRRAFLGGNSFSDISALSGKADLEELSIYETGVSDLSPLAGSTKLWDLYAAFCASLVDISPLQNLPALADVDLSSTGVMDLQPLADNLDFAAEDYLRVVDCPLSSASIDTHIPAMEARGVTVDQ